MLFNSVVRAFNVDPRRENVHEKLFLEFCAIYFFYSFCWLFLFGLTKINFNVI